MSIKPYGTVNVTIAQGQSLNLLLQVAKTIFRPPSSCVRKANRRMKCRCFECVPLTRTEAAIRYLAGVGSPQELQGPLEEYREERGRKIYSEEA
jgi:hypothetical protein